MAIGTGSTRYAAAFIEDEHFPFPVLIDPEGEAARIVETNALGAAAMLRPAQWVAGARGLLQGNMQKKTGARPFQLGTTFKVGAAGNLLYEDRENYAGDHASIDESAGRRPQRLTALFTPELGGEQQDDREDFETSYQHEE